MASNNQGDCTTDTFSITGGSGGSPVICGTNTGQHCKKPLYWLKNNYVPTYCFYTHTISHQFIFIVFVDSDGSTCSKATFTFGGGSTSRKYDIKVHIREPDIHF